MELSFTSWRLNKNGKCVLSSNLRDPDQTTTDAPVQDTSTQVACWDD